MEQGALQAAGFFAASSDGSDAGGEQRAERAVTASTRGAAQLRQACEGAVTPSAAAQCVTPAGDGTAAAVAAEPAKLEGTRRQSCTGAGVSSAGGPIQEVAPAEQAVQPEAPGKYQQTTAASGSRRSVRLAGGAGAASSSAAAEGLPRRQDEGGQGRQDEGEALVAGGAPAPFDPDDDIPTPAQRPQSRSLLPLLLALLATATALSVALPFTQKGAQSGILLGLAVAAAALLPLLFPRALLALAAPLSLSFSARVHSEELRFTECFNGAEPAIGDHLSLDHRPGSCCRFRGKRVTRQCVTRQRHVASREVVASKTTFYVTYVTLLCLLSSCLLCLLTLSFHCLRQIQGG